MVAPDRKILRKDYNHSLKMAWDEWNTPVWRKGGPFFNLDDAPELDENADYNHLVGWLLGVSEATGWSLFPKSRVLSRPMDGSPEKFREDFELHLALAWDRYLERGSISGSPFHNLEDVPELDENPDFNYSAGWLIGVAQATGWPLDPTGPREWSPRGWKGIKDRD